MKNNKRVRKAITVVMVCTLATFSAQSEQVSPPGDSMFYYKIGGGRVFQAVPRWEVTTIDLSFRAGLTGLTCGGFDPKISISNTLNSVKDGLEDMYNQMENAASAAIANLPGYILSKVNPNLYDIFMNAIAQAQTKFGLATKSCEMIEAEIRNGQDPFEEFATFSAGDTWKAGVGTDGVDINEVKEEAAKATENGMSHPCHDRAGGKDQPKYLVIGDTAEIGYNRLLERDKCLDTAVSITPTSVPLVKKFDSPSKLRGWVNVVVGELDVDVDKVGQPSSTPGAGLMPFIAQKKSEVYNIIVDLYNGAMPLTLTNLSTISAPGVVITAQVINALRTLSPQEAMIFIERISDEIAIADTIDSTLLARRALATGVKETEFHVVKPVRTRIREAIVELDEEMDIVMKEYDIRKKLMGQSIPVLLELKSAKENAAMGAAPVMKPKDTQLTEGRVIK